MTLVYLLSIPFLMLGYFVGRRYIQLHAITLRNTLQLASIITAFYIIAMLLFVNGFLSESLAGTIISLFYAFLSGVSVGKLYSQLDKKKRQAILFIVAKMLSYISLLYLLAQH
tara:strand:+ start:6232 stop:6570 length:339 start_codon:yes stop_codon:yes gene_type:complete